MCYQRIDVYSRLQFHLTSVGASVHGTDGQSIIAAAPVAVAAASSSLAVHWRHGSAADRILAKIAIDRVSRATSTIDLSEVAQMSKQKIYCCKITHRAETNCRVHNSCAVQKSSLLMMAK
jgi:hypothetical protein